jgi:hypothetical protein
LRDEGPGRLRGFRGDTTSLATTTLPGWLEELRSR